MSRATTSLNWKRPPEWDRFKDLANEIFPGRDSATGNLVDSAWHRFRQDHEAEEIIGRLLEAVGTDSAPGEGKKILTRSRDVGDGRATVRVSRSIKEEMAAFADEKDVPKYEVLRAVVCYRLAGGTLGWVSRQLKKLEKLFDDTDVSPDAKTRNRNKIIEQLRDLAGDGDLTSFTLDEFNEAIDTHPGLKISASKHSREVYLSRVLDELGFTWHPHNNDLFVSTDDIEIPDVRDPRMKPKAMMSEADTRLAVKVDALEKLASLSDSRERYQYTKDEAVGINGIAYNNAGKYMRQVADSPGFTYNEDADVLRVNKRDVLKTEIANDDALEIVGNLAIETESESETENETESKADREVETPEESDQEWLEQALEELEDVDIEEVPETALENIITGKIARAKYPDEIDEGDEISIEATERVTDDEIQQVQQKLGLVDDTEKDVDEIKAEVESEFDALENAAVATDGGQPVDE